MKSMILWKAMKHTVLEYEFQEYAVLESNHSRQSQQFIFEPSQIVSPPLLCPVIATGEQNSH